MLIIFVSIIIFAALIGLLIYRFNGRKKIFSFDLVQFVYLFVIAPTIFVWFKTFFFYAVRGEIDKTLSVGEFFIIDTLLSVIGLFLFGIVAIHTITKVFWIEKNKDPFADIYKISEYFHLWWSHILMYIGGFGLMTVISTLNLFFPWPTSDFTFEKVIIIFSGTVFGFITYFTVWTSDPLQERRSFLRLMKLFYVFFFLLHVLLYFLITPEFSVKFAFYWFTFFTFLTNVSCVFILRKSKTAIRLRNSLLHEGWGKNTYQLFVDTIKDNTETIDPADYDDIVRTNTDEQRFTSDLPQG